MATLNVKGFPDELYERLRDAAERDRRSIAQQVTVLLERALQDQEPLSLLELRGLGREIWADVDAAVHVADERGSWD